MEGCASVGARDRKHEMGRNAKRQALGALPRGVCRGGVELYPTEREGDSAANIASLSEEEGLRCGMWEGSKLGEQGN